MDKTNIGLAAVAAVAITAVLLFSWAQDDDPGESGTIRDVEGVWNTMYSYTVEGYPDEIPEKVSFSVSGDIMTMSMDVTNGHFDIRFMIVSSNEAMSSLLGIKDQLYLDGDTIYHITSVGGNMQYVAFSKGDDVTLPPDDTQGLVGKVFDIPLESISTGLDDTGMRVVVDSCWLNKMEATVTIMGEEYVFTGFVKTVGDRVQVTMSTLDMSCRIVLDTDTIGSFAEVHIMLYLGLAHGSSDGRCSTMLLDEGEYSLSGDMETVIMETIPGTGFQILGDTPVLTFGTLHGGSVTMTGYGEVFVSCSDDPRTLVSLF